MKLTASQSQNQKLLASHGLPNSATPIEGAWGNERGQREILLDVFDNVTLWKTNIAMEYPHL